MKQHGWKGQFSTPVWNAACFDWMCKDSGFYITLIQTPCWLLFVTTLTPGHTLEISIFIKTSHINKPISEKMAFPHHMYIRAPRRSGLNKRVRVCNPDLIQFIFFRTPVHVCEVRLNSSGSKLKPSLKLPRFLQAFITSTNQGRLGPVSQDLLRDFNDGSYIIVLKRPALTRLYFMKRKVILTITSL